MARNYEERLEFIEKRNQVVDTLMELQAQGLDVIRYFQDVRDGKVKPVEHYWQTDQAKGPEPGV